MYNTLSSTANPAAFDATERNAVIGVGAPSYTSGAQNWNGKLEILNPNPAMTSVIPNSSALLSPNAAAGSSSPASTMPPICAAIASSEVAPVNP